MSTEEEKEETETESKSESERASEQDGVVNRDQEKYCADSRLRRTGCRRRRLDNRAADDFTRKHE